MDEEHRISDQASGQLIQAERLASIGNLVAGVSHEINNPLGFIDSNLSTLQEYVLHLTKLIESYSKFQEAVEKDDMETAAKTKTQLALVKKEKDTGFILEDIRALITESRQGVERIKKIVVSLKMFSKATDEQKTLFNLKEILDNVLSVTESQTKYKTTIKTELADLPMVECFPQQLGHVFINLIINAVEAIEKGGSVVLQTQVCDLKDGDPGVGRRSSDPFRAGDKAVVVTVEDNGKGIPAGIKDKIYDPFFTTKEVNQGPGLGLTLSHEIVKKHSGWINVESTEGKGTKVAVYLPVTANSSGGRE